MEKSKDKATNGGAAGKPDAPDEKVTTGVWKSAEKPVQRAFPGPRGASAVLRVAIDRAAYAELIAHAKESLEAEICGVLAGTVCEDAEGLFVFVGAAIRGAAASHGSTHVTFTQETWNVVHKTLEEDHPKLQMVGRDHSHPGFGVEFSDMDIFIQKNFFPNPTQIAMVIDPIGGAVAICLNGPSGIQYVERFWVDGREQPAQVPKKSAAKSERGGDDSPEFADAGAVRALEMRMGQMIQALDDLRTSYHRFLLFIGTVVCVGMIAVFVYNFYSQRRYRNSPPEDMSFAPVPVQIGDKTVLLGVRVSEWQVPEELNALNLALVHEAALMAEKALKEASNMGNATNSAATNTAPANSKAPKQPIP